MVEKDCESNSIALELAEEELKTLTITEGEPSNVKEKEPPRETTVNLKTADGVTFEVKASIAKQMETVQTFVDASVHDGADMAPIPLPNVSSGDLRRILEYCEVRASMERGKEKKEFDEIFMKALSGDEMKRLLLVANYLGMKEFLDFMCRGIADMLQNKSVEYARDFFGIVGDYTTDEEEEYRQEHAWAFQADD
ncbi:hypothetical protein Fmac_018605 [Flemingia macrophylla]|uniref:SKP1-like protein n=1 Tax=Flemingia macrophylla TaxID=520843 RepID=A0ABD1M5G7_9FABA